MAERAFAASKYGQQLYNQAGARKLSVSTLGESHGLGSYMGAAIQYACWRHFPADIRYDHRSFAGGGNELAVGGTTTSGPNGLLTTQVGQFAARPTDIAFICSGYNDQPGNAAALTALVNNVTSAATALFAAGAKFVVIAGMVPRDVNAAQWLGYNLRIRNWCAKTNGAFFLDVSSVLADRQNSGASSVPYRQIGTYPAGSYNSMTQDGTHWARRAVRAIAPLVADIFRRICGTRTARLAFNAGNYQPVAAPYTNILGDAGNMMGTAGLLASDFHTGVAGIGPASRLQVSPFGTGYTVTPSLITGPDGERRQRLTLNGSGAAGGFPYIEVLCWPQITATNGGVPSRMMDMEVMIELTGVTGLSGIQLRPLTDPAYRSVNDASNAAHAAWPDATTESLFCYNLFPAPVPAGDNPYCTLVFTLAEGKTLAGTIDISRWSLAVVDE